MKFQKQWLTTAMSSFSLCSNDNNRTENASNRRWKVTSMIFSRKLLSIALGLLLGVSVLTTVKESLWLDDSKGQLRVRFTSTEPLMYQQGIIRRDSPSYMNMCRLYTASYQHHHHQQQQQQQQPTMKSESSSRFLNTHLEKTQNGGEVMVIEEIDKICIDASTPHTSLMTILASSWIDQIASRYLVHWNRHYRYDHNCNNRHLHTQDHKTSIQQFLPSTLTIDETQFNTMEETAAALNHVCQACLSSEENDAENDNDDGTNSNHDPSCVLFGYDRLTPNAVHRHVGEWPVLDFIQTNMEEAISNFHEETQSSASSYTENSVTIFLPCPSEDCHMGHSFYLADDTHDSQNTMPIYSIIQNIPRHVESINIVNFTPELPEITTCNESNLRPCAIQTHIGELKGLRVYLKQIVSELFPTANIGVYDLTGSGEAFANRLLNPQGLVICPIASVSCVLPALIRQQKKQNTVMLHSPSLYPYMPSLIDDNTNDNEQEKPFINFLSSPEEILKMDCPMLRGRFGHWVKNNDLASYFQYQMKDMYVAGEGSIMFKPTEEEPYPEYTTYTFNAVDKGSVNTLQFPENNEAICPFSLINNEIVCRSMKASNVKRIMMVGDSLTGHQSLSFWFQLGNTRLPNLYMNSIERYYHAWKDSIKCNDQESIELVFIRNDRMIEPKNAEEFDLNCGGEFCYTWTEEYKRFEGKTLFITNFGSHFNAGKSGITLPQASLQFANFWKNDVKERAKAGKEPNIGFFRTTATGHPDCEDKMAPFDNYQQYRESLDNASPIWKKRFFSQYRWDHFPFQNRVIMKDLDNVPNMHIADVFYMSALRPDAHISSHANPINRGNDCLHYLIPGPVDWWNYLWFSNFLDIEQITI